MGRHTGLRQRPIRQKDIKTNEWWVHTYIFKTNFMARCWGIAHDFSVSSVCTSAHPPIVSALGAGRRVILGAGLLLFLEPADSCSGRPEAAASGPGKSRSHILEDSVKKSCMLMVTDDHKVEQTDTKTALTKKVLVLAQSVHSVLIFVESLCGRTSRKRDVTGECRLFKGFNSIISDSHFLSET